MADNHVQVDVQMSSAPQRPGRQLAIVKSLMALGSMLGVAVVASSMMSRRVQLNLSGFSDLSQRDFDRAQRATPRPPLLSSHPHRSNHLLNKHLMRITRGQAQPCEDLPLSDLLATHGKMMDKSSQELQKIYEDGGSPRGGEAVEVNLDEVLRLPNQLIQQVLHEKLCYEIAQAYTHSIPDKQKAAILSEMVVPLLPNRSADDLNSMLVQGRRLSRDAKRGQKIFKTKCSVAHVVVNGVNNMGPSLYGIVGRQTGQTPDFAYSDAMTNSGVVMNKKTLSKFLTNPRKVVPGTKMIFAGLKSRKERRDLIAYLEKVSAH